MSLWSWLFGESKPEAPRFSPVAPFPDASTFAIDASMSEDCLLDLPGWHYSYPHLSGLAEIGSELPQPVAVVFYGSSVRDGGRGKDVDVLWLVDSDESEVKFQKCESLYTYDDYGACTRRAEIFHIAIVSRGELHRKLAGDAEWAVTLVRDGVLLAGAHDAGGIAWRRTFERHRLGSFPGLRICALGTFVAEEMARV